MEVIDVGNTHQVPITQTPCGITNFYAVTAYADEGLESDYSEEVWWVPVCVPPSAPGELRILSRTNYVTLEWSEDLLRWDVLGVFAMTNAQGFFRVGDSR